MKKILLSFFTIACTVSGFAQILTQSNITSVLVPKVMVQGTGRIPTVYRLNISGLVPNTVYRYNSSLATRADIGTTSSGAGVPFYMNPSNWFGGSGGFSLATSGQFDSLTTDGTGSYTGWFGLIHSTNARFAAGNYLFPVITLDSAGSARGTVKLRLAATDSILVLAPTTTSNGTSGTVLTSSSTSGTPKNFVCLYDSITTGRPISIAPIESSGVTIGSVATFYPAGVNGSWAAIVPNILTSGIRRIEQRSFGSGSIVNGSNSVNGIWGSVSTVNPTGGTASIVIAAINAPLPVKLANFKANIINKQTILNWVTSSENNNKGFEVQKSTDGKNFETIGFVKGAGNSNSIKKYTFTDDNHTNAFYRLKQIDFDGQFEYSKSVAVKNAEMLVELTPNPFTNTVEISSTKNIVSAEIVDITGKTRIAEVINGMNVTINTADLSNGIYFIRINNGETVITKRIIKN
jgi:hypothetical protein